MAGCGRPTGDFGRAQPSFLHDSILPVVGRAGVILREDPYSGFPMTDDELLLRDRAWAFVRAPHVRDWWFDTLVEGERIRLLPVLKGEAPKKGGLPIFNAAWDRGRYHGYLLSDGRRSTESLWSRVVADAYGDAELVPPFCDVASRVRKADFERLGALRRQGIVEADLNDGAEARVAENEEIVAWVWHALGYRAASYRYAIDRFQVEAPSDQFFAANRAYMTLVASRCTGAPSLKAAMPNPERHSRLMSAPDPFDEPVPQK